MSLARHMAGHGDEFLCLKCAEEVEPPADYCEDCLQAEAVAAHYKADGCACVSAEKWVADCAKHGRIIQPRWPT